MNSLLNIISTFAFICMGYLFFVKSFNQSYSDGETPAPESGGKLTKLLGSVQSNALLFTALTAVISMYWGWSPALLWVIIGTIFIQFNIETILHERLVNEIEDEDDEPFSHYLSEHSDWRRFIGVSIINAFSAFASIILIVIASKIMGDYTGTAIGVAGIAFAVIVWQKHGTTKVGRISSVCVAIFGIILSDQVGLYFIGSWQPITQFPAFVIDETWIFAIILVLLFKYIRNNESDSLSNFIQLFTTITSLCSATIFLLALYFIATARPLIDAPIHTASGNTPHFFLIISLIAIVGATNLISYLKNLSAPLTDSHQGKNPVRRHHGKVLFEVFGVIVLIFLLSSSNGIGAWNSHFVNWDASKSLIEHLNLFIDSISSTFGDFDSWGIDETAIKGVIATILLLNGLCLLNDSSIGKEYLSDRLSDHNESSPLQNLLGQFIFYGVLVSMLILGTSLNSWILLGSLSLTGIAWILLCDSHLTLECEISNPTILIVTAVIVPLACVQVIAQCWVWWSTQNWFYAISGYLLAAVYLFAVSMHSPSLIKKYLASRGSAPISLDDEPDL